MAKRRPPQKRYYLYTITSEGEGAGTGRFLFRARSEDDVWSAISDYKWRHDHGIELGEFIVGEDVRRIPKAREATFTGYDDGPFEV